MERAKIVLRRGSSQYEVEGTEEFVVRTLPELTRLLEAPDAERTAGHVEAESSQDHEREADGTLPQSLRGFFDEKAPQNASEAIACAVYYLCTIRGKAEVAADEIRQTLINAKQRPPGVMAQALTDCRRRYGYIENGDKNGFWRLSQNGEVAVKIDLPHKK